MNVIHKWNYSPSDLDCCKGILHPSYVKCKDCLYLEDILLDHPIHQGFITIDDHEYTLEKHISSLENVSRDYNSIKYWINPLLTKLTISWYLFSDSEVTSDIPLFYQCNGQVIFLQEVTKSIEESDLTTEEVLSKLISFYQQHSEYQYLHGKCDISSLRINKNNQLRIRISEFSSCQTPDRIVFGVPPLDRTPIFCKSGDTFQLIKRWEYRRREWCHRSWIVEMYCWIISLHTSCLAKTDKWDQMISTLFPDNFFNTIGTSFNQFYDQMLTLKFKEDLSELLKTWI